MKESRRTVGHGEGGRAGAVLGFDDLITTELNALDQVSVLLTASLDDGGAVGDLGEERHDGGA